VLPRNFDGWRAALREYRKLPYDIVLPGHGKPGRIELYDRMLAYIDFAEDALKNAADAAEFKQRLLDRFPDYGASRYWTISCVFCFAMLRAEVQRPAAANPMQTTNDGLPPPDGEMHTGWGLGCGADPDAGRAVTAETRTALIGHELVVAEWGKGLLIKGKHGVPLACAKADMIDHVSSPFALFCKRDDNSTDGWERFKASALETTRRKCR
jgi:hypothetical protein